MSSRSVLGVLAMLLVSRPAVALDGATLTAINSVIDRGLVCDNKVAALPVSTEKIARFTFLASGQLSVKKEGAPGTLAFEEAGIAKVLIPGTSTIGACDSVEPNLVYALEKIAGGKSAVSIMVFATVKREEKYLIAYRDKYLAEMRQIEREGVHADNQLQQLSTTARIAFLMPDDTNLDRVLASATTTLAGHTATCSSDTDKALAPAVCDEVLSVELTVAALKAAAIRLKQVSDLNAAKQMADRQKVAAAEKLVDLAVSLKASPGPSDVAKKAQCDRIARYQWLDQSRDAPRLLTAASLPLVTDVIVAAYGDKVPPVEHVKRDVDRALLVTGVPFNQSTKFAVVEGARTTLTIETMFATLFPIARSQLTRFDAMSNAATLVANMKKFDTGKALIKTLADPQADIVDLIEGSPVYVDLSSRSMLSVLCSESTVEPQVDWDLPASSNVDHRTHIFQVQDRDHAVNVALCAGAECTGKDDDKNVKTRATLTPSRAGTVTLLAEVSVGYGVKNGTNDHRGFATQSAPAFQPVLGNEGPDQVYELQQSADPQDVVSTSLLLAVRVHDKHVIAVGPSLTTGSSAALFKQWNARWGRTLVGGLMFTAGLSVRAVPVPQDYDLGDRISIPRTTDMKPPVTRTYYSAVLQLEVGLAFDLASVTTLASDVYKAIGGK